MKIQTDQLTGLTQSKEARTETSTSSDAFASILAKTVDASATQETGLAAPVLLSTYGALNIAGTQATEETDASAPSSGEELAAMNDMNTLLTQWDDYANQLADGSSGDSLKKAYGTLQDIESGVQQLKDGLSSSTSTGLGSMVNELEVMATTEKIKFDRGDYL
jgi:hypothetical protein